MATLQEIATASSMADWSLTGRKAVVKVVTAARADATARARQAQGYVTQAKYLNGLNCNEIERDLGLQPMSCVRGVYVFYFERLPTAQEVRQRFSCDLPDGKPWDEDDFARFNAERDRFRMTNATLVDGWPPGSPKIKQWKLVKKVPLSVRNQLVTSTLPFVA